MEQVLAAPPPPSTTTPNRSGYRINSIDLLRGLIMIIMALDHTRDYFHAAATTDDPLNLQTTTPILFFTRWITHFCAPVFVFLAGTSGYFQSARKSKPELSRFLISRGLWLIVADILLFSFIFSFDPGYHFIALETLWSIGISMVFLGLAVRSSFKTIFIIGLLIVLGHNALDFFEEGKTGLFPFWYALFHHFGVQPLDKTHNIIVLYPFLPWTGLMFLGYCFGRLYTSYEGRDRKKLLLRLGFSIIAFFIALRAINVYGNPEHWQTQKNTLFTFLSFIKTHKYPPSLLFMCMTIGPALLFLAWAGNAQNKLARIIMVYGRVPFFYFLVHFFLLHLATSVCYLLRGHSFAEGVQSTGGSFFTARGEGYSLGVTYLVWIGVVIAMYPLCKWFSDYKAKHKKWWLSYL